MAIINNTDINILPLATATRLPCHRLLGSGSGMNENAEKDESMVNLIFFATFLCLW